MNNTLKLAGAFLALALVNVAQALPMINGQINIGALGSTVAVNQTSNTVTFSPTATNAVNNAQVTFTNGDYAVVPLQTVGKYFDFNYNSGLGATNQVLWSLPMAGFTLTNYTTIDETVGGGVTLQGTGTATLTGFDPTPGFWSFSADRASNTALFSFSSTNISPIPGVPDSGATAAMLGAALVGLGLISRRRRA